MIRTPEQQQAIEHTDGRLTLVAGAGAGKTGVLTERFVRLVAEEGVPVDAILTITFTRKATAEMKARIVRELEWRGLNAIRRQVEYAYIHTVHALCRRLLLENPFEAGVDPNLHTLDERAARRLKQAAFEHALASLLSGESGGVGDRSNYPYIRELIARYLNLGGYAARGDPLHTLRAMVDTLLERARHAGLSLKAMEAWASEPSLSPRERIQQMLVHSPLTTRHSPLTTSSFEEWLPAMQERLVELHRQAEDAQVKAFCLSWISLLSRVEGDQEERAEGLRSALLHLAAAYAGTYERMKEQAGGLDFADLQIHTLELLRNSPTVCHRYQQRFRYIMVDEFQDIDPLQAQIIELLAGEGNVMVVGDLQQAIYGFRFADLRVFQNWIERTRQQRERLIEMHRNFRSKPEILNFVAQVFEPLWGQAFRALQPARWEAAGSGQQAADQAVGSRQWAVEDRMGECENGGMGEEAETENGKRKTENVKPQTSNFKPQTSNELPVQVWYFPIHNRLQEATLIASTIREWVEQGSLAVHDLTTGEVRPARYGDFALLFHQFTAVNTYETALQGAGVPYFVVGGGRGYWLRYEVRDLLNLLKALQDEEDELAWISLLRSPMVGLSLDSIVLLVLQAREKGKPLSNCVQSPPDNLWEEDRMRLQAFCDWFLPLRTESSRRSVAWTLGRALELSHYEARLLLLPDGAQQVANVRKLWAMALDEPGISLQEFAERLEVLSRVEQREGNAPTYEEEANVVRLFTVHGAKGLEFPVVFVADPGFRKRPRDTWMECEPQERWLGLRWKEYASVCYQALKEQSEQREREESQRTLYVALTRARDYLIICLTQAQNPWATALNGALRYFIQKPSGMVQMKGGTRLLWRRIETK